MHASCLLCLPIDETSSFLYKGEKQKLLNDTASLVLIYKLDEDSERPIQRWSHASLASHVMFSLVSLLFDELVTDVSIAARKIDSRSFLAIAYAISKQICVQRITFSSGCLNILE